MTTGRWTHPSARLLLNEGDPERVIVDRARRLVFEAIEAGWSGPPFDPIRLADMRNIVVTANPDVVDARTSVGPSGGLLLEFNPNQPRGRRRYSIAHEIAHALFPDVGERVRFRAAENHERDDDWQLETLCNLAAAELLMPVGSLPPDAAVAPGIDAILALRSAFDVSVEAITLRLVRLARRPVAAFAASRDAQGQYRIDYLATSSGWRDARRPRGVGAESVVSQCTAIGFTAKGFERWPGLDSEIQVECVGIPPYPGQRVPRVAGVITPRTQGALVVEKVLHVRGSATEPRGSGQKLLLHVVNDRTPRWGGGFAVAVARKWPMVQKEFIAWVDDDRSHLRLGGIRVARVDDTLSVVSLIAQRGYGPSPRPRIRYEALETCIAQVAELARASGSSVHAPTIGAGQAGGNWAVIKGLLDEILCAQGISVTIYSLPGAPDLSVDTQERPQQLAIGG